MIYQLSNLLDNYIMLYLLNKLILTIFGDA